MACTKPVSSYTYTPMIMFKLCIRHSKRLTTITNNKLEQWLCECGLTLKILTEHALHSPFLWWREMMKCLRGDTRWGGWHSVRLLLTPWQHVRRGIIWASGLWVTAGNWNHRKWKLWGGGEDTVKSFIISINVFWRNYSTLSILKTTCHRHCCISHHSFKDYLKTAQM